MVFTCEQVSRGHPDKICDQIADAVLTDCLRHDRDSRVAVECMIKDSMVLIAGEITSKHFPDFKALVQDVLRKIGLPDVEAYSIHPMITCQSADIALGVDRGGAGDQGIVYGYATNETPELMPLPFMLATQALEMLAALEHPTLLPDAKSQVTYDYKAGRIDTFLISTQHKPNARLHRLRKTVSTTMEAAADLYNQNTDFRVLVNPTGRFEIGGSFADTGVTGRKIIADSYGGICRHGGGAFSGKDPTKIDRSGAYIARKIARDLVLAGDADRCEVQLAYAIGIAEPVSVALNCFGTNHFSKDALIQKVKTQYDLTPRGIIDRLGLLDVDYTRVSAYGHFGKKGLPWEQ